MVASGVQRDLHYSPFLPEVMEDPFPFYRRLRDEQPVYYMPTYNAWVLSRFDDIWTATEQPEIFTTIHGTTAAQAVSKVEPPVPSLNQIDPPEHTHLRKTLRDFFSRASALALEPMIRASDSSATRRPARSTPCADSPTPSRPGSRAASSRCPMRQAPSSSPGCIAMPPTTHRTKGAPPMPSSRPSR